MHDPMIAELIRRIEADQSPNRVFVVSKHNGRVVKIVRYDLEDEFTRDNLR